MMLFQFLRKHVSTYSLSNLLPSYLGRSLELELTMLSKINENINKPVMAIIEDLKYPQNKPFVQSC